MKKGVGGCVNAPRVSACMRIGCISHLGFLACRIASRAVPVQPSAAVTCVNDDTLNGELRKLACWCGTERETDPGLLAACRGPRGTESSAECEV